MGKKLNEHLYLLILQIILFLCAIVELWTNLRLTVLIAIIAGTNIGYILKRWRD